MVSSATPLRNSPTSYLPRRLGAITPMLLSAALAFLLFAAPAALAAPANDNFASAEAVSALPLSHVVDTAGGTTEEGEPQFCSTVDNSAWYAITPSEDAILSADASGTWPPAQINVYRQDASGLGGLSFLACQNWSSEPVVFRVQAGSTYYLQASTLYSAGGQLRVNVDEVQAPANDNFGDATPISSVPFGDDVDLLGASAQPSEPTDCIGTDQKTAWYAFTPSRTDSYAVERSGGRGYLPLAVYTGRSLSSLSQVACAGYSAAIFRAEAGKTYYLQLGHGYGSGSIHLSLDTAPPASASFYHYRSDPSIFDTVSFYDYSSDPAGIASWAWAFGDRADRDGPKRITPLRRRWRVPGDARDHNERWA